MAIAVRDEEDDSEVVALIHRVEAEVRVVVDNDLEAVAAFHDTELVPGHNGVGAVVREDGLDLRGLGIERGASGLHVVE
jgi:hypothetical protein